MKQLPCDSKACSNYGGMANSQVDYAFPISVGHNHFRIPHPRSTSFVLHFNNLLGCASLAMLSALMNGILELFSYHLHPAYGEE